MRIYIDNHATLICGVVIGMIGGYIVGASGLTIKNFVNGFRNNADNYTYVYENDGGTYYA